MASKTNQIPGWSANLSVNVPKDERDLLQRFARSLGARSMAQLIKQLVAEALAARCPKTAEELREIRRRYYGSILLLTFLTALAASWVNHDDLQRSCRRCARRGGFRFVETIEIEEG